jgi:hypothetical protein
MALAASDDDQQKAKAKRIFGGTFTAGSTGRALFSGISDPNIARRKTLFTVGHLVMSWNSKIERTNLTGGAVVNELLCILFAPLPPLERLGRPGVGFRAGCRRFSAALRKN